MRRVAIITGITGQDGSYLAELLLGKQYNVIGLARRSSSPNLSRIASIVDHPALTLCDADMSDASSLYRVFANLDAYDRIEVYNLAAQSHVHSSFRQPEYTGDVDALGPLRVLEAIRHSGLIAKTRFYQASTSELFGKVREVPQSEDTPFYPSSPYAVSKLYAFWIVKNYRESYGMYACNGILFNHESERRGEEFITRKITTGLSRVYSDPEFVLELGNLNARRDWGYAPEYVEGMWRMLQQDTAEDFVLATGETHSVREFVEEVMKCIGRTITWSGEGVDEIGTDQTGRTIVKINPANYRPAEVDLLVGNASRARDHLGWSPSTPFTELVARMVRHDFSGSSHK
jgi:GDPmannose 4,6-dehydratase